MIRFPVISKMILRSLVGEPSTLMHPQRQRIYPEATRGRVHNEIEKCIFCRLCEQNCPTAAIHVSKEDKTWQIDSLKCCVCRRCVEVCPKKCIIMESVYFPPVRSRTDGVYLRMLPPCAGIEKEPKSEKAGTSEHGAES